MQTSKIAASLIALASLTAGAAFAADDQALAFSEAGSPFPVTASTKSRAEVKAEYQAAQAAGTLPVISEAGKRVPVGASAKTRADVRADYLQADKNHSLPKVDELG